MFLTLNELSIYNNHIDTEYSTKAQIEEFVVFCRDLNTKSIIDEIIFPESLFSIPIEISPVLRDLITVISCY